MTRLAPLFAAATFIAVTSAHAQQGTPGAHFIENWDLDANGQVSLQEASTKRSELFAMFDRDDSGVLDSAEYDLFDQTRLADMAENAGGHVKGPMRVVNEGMTRSFNDTDGNGLVAREEFLSRSSDWFGLIDVTGDGVVDTDDFTRRNDG